MASGEANRMTLTFRCPPELESVLPRPIPALFGLPDQYKTKPVINQTPDLAHQAGEEYPSFIEAMSYGFLMPLLADLELRDGEFTWHCDMPPGYPGWYPRSPIDFHDPSQIAGTPFSDHDCFVIKFNNLWTIEAPKGYSVLFTHPVNRADLPFRTMTGLVDCDTFSTSFVNFPARWHDTRFNGVLPKGTPVAQCLPVKRKIWSAHI